MLEESKQRQVVSTHSNKNLTIASDAKNSLIEDRKTARPSAPRQKGVCPAPFI